MSLNIKASVIITTYNQQDYIKAAIDSVLSQITDFEFEIIVSDDCSTDNTSKIVQEIAKAYPDKIKTVFRNKNVGISKNWCDALLSASGEYITTLEGDDYWTDDYKLQKQMDFLEANPQYFAVSHKRSLMDDNGKVYTFFNSDYGIKNNIVTLKNFAKGYTFSYTACLHKNFLKKASQAEIALITCNRSIADFQLCLLLLSQGSVYILPDIMGVYRISGESKKAQSYTSSSSIMKKFDDAASVISKCEKYGFSKFNFARCYAAWAFMPVLEAVLSKRFADAANIIKKLPFKAKLRIVPAWARSVFRMLRFKICK